MKDTAGAILTRSERESQWKNAFFSAKKFVCALIRNENENDVRGMRTYRKSGRNFLQVRLAKLCMGGEGWTQADKRGRNNCA